MDAYPARTALFAVALIASYLGQAGSLTYARQLYSARSQHFIVTAPTPQLAQEVAQAAETYRRDLAIEWLGHELPPWHGVCPIAVKLDPGAGGATSFVFQGNVPTQWTMSVQGSRERILDSVLPHEITHTIFATHFGRPLPRWADEGGSTTVEHTSEKTKQDNLLIRFLSSQPSRGIAFNRMFAMKEYPPDILPLYSQGYSLARYFIQQGGKRKFVEYVGEGMRTNNWTATTQKYYGFKSLSDLQSTWVNWVQQGSPPLADNPTLASAAVSPSIGGTQMASLTQQPQSRVPDGALSSWQTIQAQNARGYTAANQVQPAARPTYFPQAEAPPPQAEPNYSTVSRPVSDGWYVRQRDQAQALLKSSPQVTPQSPPPSQQIPPPPTRSASPSPDRRVLMEWNRPVDRPFHGPSDLTGVAMNQSATMTR